MNIDVSKVTDYITYADKNDVASTTCFRATNEIKEPKRTINDNLLEISEILSCSEAIINKIIDFVWSDRSVDNGKGIEIVNMDSNIVDTMYKAKRIRDKLNVIADRLGC